MSHYLTTTAADPTHCAICGADASRARRIGYGQATCSGPAKAPAAPAARPATKPATRGTWTGCKCGSVVEYERPSDCASCRHDRD